MRIIVVTLCACFFLAGCDMSTQSPKPSPLHYARIDPKQCALGCCWCKRHHIARAVPIRHPSPKRRLP